MTAPGAGAPARLRILWLKTELLHPVDRGGRIRTYNMLRELRRTHEVTYVAFTDETTPHDALEQADEYCSTLVPVPVRLPQRGSAAFLAGLARSVASPLPYVVWRCRSPEMEREIVRRTSAGEVDVVVCDFLFPSINVPAALPCPTVIFQHNVEAMIWRRHADIARNPLKRALMRDQWRKIRRFEAAECRRFDRVIAVSEEDRALFESEYGCRGVEQVPTGVDTSFFRPAGREPRRAHEMVFTGAMDWLPNEDGIAWFAEAILPRVRAAIPDAALTIVGRRPSARVRALAAADGSVTVTGGVPDVRPYLERAALFVVPLRIGGGTRLKIFEAMAMEKPIVSTTIGAEGLPVIDGEHLRIADDPDAFAGAVVELLRDAERARSLGDAAAALVRAEYGWAGVAERFGNICARLAAGARHASIHQVTTTA
ncbi:MAG: glycosyltransferase [Gemmatimonadaceae bacterium]